MELNEYAMKKHCLVKPYNSVKLFAYSQIPAEWNFCEIVHSYVKDMYGRKVRVLVIDK